MKKIATVTALFASALTATTSLQAASHFMKGMINNYDLNQDGQVTTEEYAKVRVARFATTDSDGNGTISPAEYLAEFEVRLESMLKASEIRKTDKAFDAYRGMDSNLDHVVTHAEYVNAAEKAFAKHDKNEDGLLTKADSKSRRFSRNVMQKYDTNGDNEVTYEEFAAEKEKSFALADTSKNKALSRIEYVLASEKDAIEATKSSRDGQIKQTDIRFDSVDTNDDKIMTWEEYEASGIRMFDHLDTNKDGVLDDTDPAPKRDGGTTAQNEQNQQNKQVASNDGAR